VSPRAGTPHTEAAAGRPAGVDDVDSFHRLATLYDRLMPGARAGPLAEGLARAARPVERLLDVAGGGGRAGRAVTPAAVVVDAAPGMARVARGRGHDAVVGDATRLPVRTRSVDAVLVVDALHHVPDHAAALAECRRVLRPGGVAVLREFDPATLAGRALAAAEHAVGFGSTFRTPDALAALVADAGLEAAVVDRGVGYTVVGKREREVDGDVG